MNPYQAYNRASHTVPKTKQVVMLYDGIIRMLQQAAQAMEDNQIEERYNKLLKASEIIIGLQACLDYDQGEEAAQVLYDFYASLDSRIIGLHRSNDAVLCRELIAEVKEMRELWNSIDKGMIDQPDQQAAQPPYVTNKEYDASCIEEESTPAPINVDSGVAVSA